MSDIHSTLMEQIQRIILAEREASVTAVIRPRPRWLPTWLWRRLLFRLVDVTLTTYSPGVTRVDVEGSTPKR